MPIDMSRERFEALVDAALDEIPDELARLQELRIPLLFSYGRFA
jgi:predicted Zn-dependent protease with MMP-like domain